MYDALLAVLPKPELWWRLDVPGGLFMNRSIRDISPCQPWVARTQQHC